MTEPSSILSYGLQEPDHRLNRWLSRAPVILAVLLSAVAVQTCLRIEMLNHLAGGILPREEEGKWRVAAPIEEMWRWNESRIRNDPTLATRPLTPPETAELNAFIRRSSAEGDLRDMVRTWGLAQYLIVPAIFWLSAVALQRTNDRRRRMAMIACLMVSIICGVMAAVRRYGPGF